MTFNKKLLVFPTSRAIREYLKHIKDQNALLPTFLTIDEFLKKTLTFNARTFIDEEQRFLYLKEACEIDELKHLGLSSEFSFFFKQSDYLFRFFGELVSEGIEIDSLTEYDTYEFYKEHISVLKYIYERYMSILDKNNAVEKINLPKYYEINKEFLNKFDEIGLFFEGYLTKIEFDIIYKVANQKKLFVNLNSNEYNKKSLQHFESLGLKFELNKKYIIDLSEVTVIEEEKHEVLNTQYHVTAFSSRSNQVAYIKKSVNDMINKGIEPDRIALVLPDESFAATLQLHSNEGYFNYAMGLSIHNEKIYKVLKSVNDYLMDEEDKAIDELNFFKIDRMIIDQSFKPLWNEKLTPAIFNAFYEFVVSYEYKDEILEKLSELKFKLEQLFFNNSEFLSLKESVKILIQKISALSLDDINSGPVTVMGLLETRSVNFDGVILIDFNEAYVPKRSIKDKFISTSIKKNVGLPTPNDRENLQKYYYHRLITQAKQVNISYVQNESMQISRFANELIKVKHSDIKDKEYAHILFNQHKTFHFDEEVQHNIDLKKFTWSATALKIYLSCKRKFYLQYIAKIQEHEKSYKPKGFELGSLIHDVLQKVYEKYTIEDISIQKLVEALHEEKIDNAYLLLDLEVWKRRLEVFVEAEKQRSSFKVVGLEKTFDIEHKGIRLKGAIDRIDQINDGYYIIDYKTSSALKVDTIKNYEKSTDFQLEFYYLACKNMFESKNIKPYYYDLYENKLKEELVLEQKLELLDCILDELPNGLISFDKCEDKKECQFCTYKTLCDR